MRLLIERVFYSRASYNSENTVDLSNEVLNIDFGQGAAKISEVKVGGKKNICPSARLKPEHPESAALANLFSTSNFGL